jgi:hypothetical protein
MNNEQIEKAIEFILSHQADVEVRQQKAEERLQKTEELLQTTNEHLQELSNQLSNYAVVTESRLNAQAEALEKVLQFVEAQRETNAALYENLNRLSKTQIMLAEVQKQSLGRQDKLEEGQNKLENSMDNLANAINNLANTLSKNGNSSQQ